MADVPRGFQRVAQGGGKLLWQIWQREREVVVDLHLAGDLVTEEEAHALAIALGRVRPSGGGPVDVVLRPRGAVRTAARAERALAEALETAGGRVAVVTGEATGLARAPHELLGMGGGVTPELFPDVDSALAWLSR